MGSISAPKAERKAELDALNTFDELIRQRAVDKPQTPLIAYPKSKLGVDDYEFFTGRDLNRLVDGGAKALMGMGLEPVYEPKVVGLYALSDLDYAVTIFALARLGYTSFLLSPRLPANACVSLLKGEHASHLLYSPRFHSLATATAHELPLKLLPMPVRSEYDDSSDNSLEFLRPDVDGKKESFRKLVMMHSSGSTGLPRPIDYTHKRLLVTLLTSQDMVAFQSVPLFHAHGFVTFIQAIFVKKCIYVWNGNVPQTNETVTRAIRVADPEILWTVPYVLKLLAEKTDGIELLKRCKVVSCSGSRCPDELGDLMVANGIHFGTNFGATEVALILSSLDRPREDKAWNYLRPPPHVAPYIRMKPVDGPICECVVLDGHRGKVMSNSDDPPNSYHTKDLFIAHSTIPDAWKFVGRLDDRVTLTTGEKVLPLPMEGRIQQDALVKEAVVFGVDRTVPGLLLFRAKSAECLSDGEFLERIWPAIEDANSRAEGFSQISRDMVAVIPEDIDCPSTDKSSIKRAQVYRDFASVIDDIYTRLEKGASGDLKLSVPELEAWIFERFKELGITLGDADTDFFAAGVDSQRAIQMRGLIVKSLDLGENIQKCGSMIVYDCGNSSKLARVLYALQNGESTESGSENEKEVMSALIKQYSSFQKHVPGTKTVPKSHTVVLTGATGSLGSHLLAQLVTNQKVAKVYCLVRTSPQQSASERLETALRRRNLPLSSSKIIPLSADISAPDLGLDTTNINILRSETTHIIHCAWAVNFALSVQSFEPQIAGLCQLISLSLSVATPRPATLIFCSSVGAAMATPSSENGLALVAEEPIDDFSYASATGYARSKLVAEHVVETSVREAGARATVLRIGQIIPNMSSGPTLWNPNEMIPLMVRSALTVRALPDESGPGSADECSWLDVDTLAEIIIELGELDHEDNEAAEICELLYNVVHPQPFSWKRSFLPALRSAGLEFGTVSYSDWLERLGASENDTKKNPSRKLLNFWNEQARLKSGKKGEVRFETRKAQSKSQKLRVAQSPIEGRAVEEMLRAWRKVW